LSSAKAWQTKVPKLLTSVTQISVHGVRLVVVLALATLALDLDDEVQQSGVAMPILDPYDEIAPVYLGCRAELVGTSYPSL
jgi:hypothetical protein